MFFTRMTEFYMNKNKLVIDLDTCKVKLGILFEKVAGVIGAFKTLPCETSKMERFGKKVFS